MQVTSELAASRLRIGHPREGGDPACEAQRTLSSILDHSLHRFGRFPANPHLAVAVSGGADSMALAHLADAWARDHNGRITALTVDHGLRLESRSEAENVAAWMHARGIAHHILTPAPTTESNNMQEAARLRRYNALAEWCHTQDVLHCLIGHHAGDQRETVSLMNSRGATADGTSGMNASRNYHGVRFLRPLLTVEKEELKEYLRTHAVDWVEDPSNEKPEFTRVRVRQQLASDDAAQDEAAQMLLLGRVARSARDITLAKIAAAHVTIHPLGFAEMDYAAWKTLKPTLASQLLADLLTTISGATHRPRSHETLRLCKALRTDFSRATLHACDITLDKNILRIARESARCEAPVDLSGSGSLTWDKRFHVHYTLPQTTMLSLHALGKNPHGLPVATPAIWHLDELLFVPHIVTQLPDDVRVEIGFAPAKPLAAAPFWWLN